MAAGWLEDSAELAGVGNLPRRSAEMGNRVWCGRLGPGLVPPPGGWHPPLAFATLPPMRLLDMQAIGAELALKWDDGGESFIPLEALRRACPCAGCKGEVDALGQLHQGPEIALTAASFRLARLSPVGGYAIQPTWTDGHNSGLYPFAYLKRLGEAGPG